MKRKHFLLSLMLLLCASISFSQTPITRTIKGTITDEAGKPVEGVSVLLRGTKTGTQTDAAGNFSIKTTSTGKVDLVISSTGFTGQTISTDGKTDVAVKLVKAVEQLDDVVVIGYQTVKKKDVLASVSSVSAKDLKDIPINSAAEALAGRLAGVQITTAEGSPDADVRIRVRGGGSITQDNSPLYVIDGVQVENGLSTISPQDIQSIDVLKDAAATAIYGARGANGVVIITTKGGKPGKLQLTYNGFFGLKNLTKTLPVLSPYEFILNEYERTRGSSTDSATFSKRYGTTWDTLGVYKNISAVDWQKESVGQQGYTQTHNIALSGGNKFTTFNLSYTNNNDKAIVRNSGYNRNLVTFKLDHKLTKNLKMGFTVRFTDQTVFGAGVSDDKGTSYNRLRNAVKYRPFLSTGIASVDVIDPNLVDPSVGNGLILINPVALDNAEYRKKKTTAASVSAYANYDIVKNLSFRSTVGIDYNSLYDRSFEDSIAPYSITQGAAKPVVGNDTTVRQILTNSNVLTYSIRNYKKKHNFDVLIGEETYRLNSNISRNLYRDFPTFTTPDKAFETLGTANVFTGYPKFAKAEFTSLSFFGRLSYNYNQKYFLTVNARADGSSKFAEDKRWGYFPSTSIAWRISRESFMKKLNFINDMKLRLSYGEVGNNRINDYLYINTFSNSTYYYGINGQVVPGYTSTGLVNPNLRWETTASRNIGLDISMFKSRVNLTLDYYNNSVSHLLLNAPISPTYGSATQIQNIGATSNKGWELQLNVGVVQNKNFTWNANFNLANNENKIEALAQNQVSQLRNGWSGVSGQPADYILKIGEPVGSMYGLITDGFYKVDDFNYDATAKTYTLKTGVVTDASIIGTPQPGMIKFKDLNGDGKVDVDNDRTIIGNAQPKLIGGLNQTFIYKNFDASVFLNFVYGNNVYNANKIEFTNNYTPNSNLLAIMQDRWRTINSSGQVVTDPTQLAALNANATIWKPIAGAGAFYPHSWAIEDGSFLRINNISLGYTFHGAALKNLKISRLRLYTTVNNVAVLTNYSGYDPEVNVKVSDPTTPGLDYSAYPKSRSFIIGVNVSFQ